MTTIGFIGSGNIGSQVARRAVANGFDVVMSNSRGPETLAALIEELGPRATAATRDDAAAVADIAVVSIPFRDYASVPVDSLAGKIVIDTNNYYFERDGRFPGIDSGEDTPTGLLQAHLPASRVVKAFNHIPAADITADASPARTPGRRALAIAGDDSDAKTTVAGILDRFGFDVVDVGTLGESWRVDRDQPAYGPRQDAAELTANLAKATR